MISEAEIEYYSDKIDIHPIACKMAHYRCHGVQPNRCWGLLETSLKTTLLIYHTDPRLKSGGVAFAHSPSCIEFIGFRVNNYCVNKDVIMELVC